MRIWRKSAALSLIALGLAAGHLSLGLTGAMAQVAAISRGNNTLPVGQRLTSDMVRDELERRIAMAPRNESTLWNVGYDFYRNFPQNQDTARAIMQGFLRARADTPAQKQILTKAAIYWEKIHNYGVANVPVGQDPNTRDKIYYGGNSKFTTLAKRRPGSQHQGYPPYDWPGRHINKRAPYYGRPANPYPGKYYPGMYPP
ncbi:hypothetical protein LJB86_00745 [Deltaproteobacteria bacterium OttesenSCG-928-M10]|nr:hypothetical protein [Deltaproteobacteria bacterium OttesenSCG-928-M10]